MGFIPFQIELTLSPSLLPSPLWSCTHLGGFGLFGSFHVCFHHEWQVIFLILSPFLYYSSIHSKLGFPQLAAQLGLGLIRLRESIGYTYKSILAWFDHSCADWLVEGLRLRPLWLPVEIVLSMIVADGLWASRALHYWDYIHCLHCTHLSVVGMFRYNHWKALMSSAALYLFCSCCSIIRLTVRGF